MPSTHLASTTTEPDAIVVDEPSPGGADDRRVVAEPTRSQITQTALSILDEAGVEHLTRAAVAARLRCRSSDLEAHAGDDEALIDLACDAVYAQVTLDPPDRSWPARLREYCRSYRRALLRHPNATPFIAVRPIVHDAALVIAERTLSELTGVGFSAAESNRVLLVIVSFVNGHALTELGELSGTHGRNDDLVRSREALEPHRLPVLTEALAAGNDRDAEFELGLELIIGGLERRLLHAAPR